MNPYSGPDHRARYVGRQSRSSGPRSVAWFDSAVIGGNEMPYDSNKLVDQYLASAQVVLILREFIYIFKI